MAFTHVHAGERTRPVRIEQRSPTDANDAAGFPQETWTTLAPEVFMKRTDGGVGRNRERFAANEISAPMETKWELGYRADMDPDTVDVPRLRRLVYRGRIFDILHADVLGQWQSVRLVTLARQG